MTVRIGLIGAGRMGATLAHHLASSQLGIEFLSIADPLIENAEALAKKFHVPAIFNDHRELLQSNELDAVVIATPTNTHTDIIKAAAASGKHIFTEKPLALTVQSCDEAISAVHMADVKMMVGFMRRFDPAYVTAKGKIDDGIIGQPVMVKLVGRDPWRTSVEYARRANSGGLIADMAIHEFDLARWLMGSEIVRVSSEGGCLVFPELEDAGDIDNAVINLKFANGAVGNVDVSRCAIYGYDIRTEVVGSEGSLFVGDLQQNSTRTLTKGMVSYETLPGFQERFAEAYRAEIRDFIETIETGRDVAVPGEDARAATKVAIAATMSLDQGRAVRVDEVDDID